MKRDMELIRKIILQIEDSPSPSGRKFEGFEAYTAQQFGYHCYLIVDDGLATGTSVATLGNPGPNYLINHLTSKGHDFAEAARTEFIWGAAMKEVEDKGLVGAGLDVIRKILDKKLRKHLDLD